MFYTIGKKKKFDAQIDRWEKEGKQYFVLGCDSYKGKQLNSIGALMFDDLQKAWEFKRKNKLKGHDVYLVPDCKNEDIKVNPNNGNLHLKNSKPIRKMYDEPERVE